MRPVVLAVLPLAACVSARVGLGAAADSEGRVSVQLATAVGFGGGQTAASGLVGLGLHDGDTVRSAGLVVHHFPLQPVRPDELRPWLVRADARFGARARSGHDAVAFLGAGVAYLKVFDGDASGCAMPGLGTQTRHGAGVELLVDGHLGDDPDLGWGQATLGLVYQVDWYLRGPNDCGS